MFNILRMGCNTLHDDDFFVDRPNGYDWYLLLLVKTPAIFVINDESISTPADTLIIYDKHYAHKYQANGTPYKNDWIHFEVDPEFIDQFSVSFNRPIHLLNPYYLSDLIQKMSNEFYSNHPYKDETINYLMKISMLKIKEQTELKVDHLWRHKLYDELIQLRGDIYSNPQKNWSIASMANRLHISSGYLQNIYKDFFDTSCMADVIESRHMLAKELLIESHLSVKEISYKCGFKNDVHFMRQFKQLIGITPTQYRKLNSK